jgi:hypothetical protein
LAQTHAHFIPSTCRISCLVSIPYFVQKDKPQSVVLWNIAFRSKLLRCWVVSNSPYQQTGGHPLSDVCCSLFSTLSATLRTYTPPPLSQREGAPHRYVMDALCTADDTLQLSS